MVHEAVAPALEALFLERVRALRLGDPYLDTTHVGPLITEAEAVRLERWEAVELGAKVLVGGRRHGAFYEPTVLSGAPPHCQVEAEEAFGPLCTWGTFKTWEEGVARANASRFGLQTGIFTPDIKRAFYAFEHLHVGGVVLNDVPTARVDAMPCTSPLHTPHPDPPRWRDQG